MHVIRLYLVRHGHVNYFDAAQQPINPKYAPLSAQGEQQIQILAEHLHAIQMDQIYSSTMPRSIQTAEILASTQKLKTIQSYGEIREIKSGRLKDIPVDQAELIIKQAYSPKKYVLDRFLQGESWGDFETRVITWFEQMLLKQHQLPQHQSQELVLQNHQSKAQLKPQHILVSAHDAVNRIVLNWVQGLKNHDVQVHEQNYGCLNIVDFYLEDQRIVESRILLQNFTAYNILKINESENALDQVYNIYMQTNGFKGDVA